MSGEGAGDRPADDPAAAAQTGAPASAGAPTSSGVSADEGADAVREALNRARAVARERNATRSAGRRSPRSWAAARAPRAGSGPDARDPQSFASAVQRLVDERGWTQSVSVGGAMGRWAEVVGADIAAHCQPETFEDGVLTVRAESTAWATQVRLLVPSILRSLDERLGEGTVAKIVVRGPGGPSWRHGSRVAPGSQGPRDTYG